MTCIRKRAPKASSNLVRLVMQANKGRDTTPEKLLRAALHANGLRFRKDFYPEPDLRIKADIVFVRLKICIFIDGCFWHVCPAHFKVPKTNTAWWQEKITDTARRDIEQTRILSERGWSVIRIWEHDIVSSKISEITQTIQSFCATDS